MCGKARKSGNGEIINGGALSSVFMDRVMTRRMLREALIEEEKRVTEMLMEKERRYREMMMEKEKIEVVMIEDDEEEMVMEKMAEEEEEVAGIGMVGEEEKVDEEAAESGAAMGLDDWGWTWSCEENQKWWEDVCYPYWETMCVDALAQVDDEELPWEDDIWNLKDIKEVPKP